MKGEGEPYHHGSLAVEAVSAAKQVVTEGGVEALNLRSLASRLGVSHPALYRHFANRDELIDAVVDDLWWDLAAVIRRAQVALPAEPMTAAVAAYARAALEAPPRYALIAMVGSAASGEASLRPGVGEVVGLVAGAATASGVPEAEVRDVVFSIWGSVHGLCDLLVKGHARMASVDAGVHWVVERTRPILTHYGLR